ncbi:MAG: Cupin 2 conserved barrel domain protein [Firmicutes bacterium]|nr:Cupin 2 conserved barrel domain protein [Bacillota bacterium]
MTKGINYSVKDIGLFDKLEGKVFVGKDLGLTGTEVSVSKLAAGTASPFVHAHKKNEELYLVIGGKGMFYVDGEEFPVQEGSLIRVAPAGERALKAGDKDLYYICIQAEAGSLKQATREDGIMLESKPSWMK